MIVLDTNVISALMRDVPDETVIRWLDRQQRASIWTTSINVFETRFGLYIMPAGKRQTAMMALYERVLSDTIQGRIALFDSDAAQQAAELHAQRKVSGRPGELRNTMIAGIVLASHATLATSNVKHFEDIAPSLVNPWVA
jgi:predicted nucleic acid-binding protein